jgi:hypothetical protein
VGEPAKSEAKSQKKEEVFVIAVLVDTSVVVDVLRGYPPAITWLNTQTQNVGVTRFVWYEVIEGCANKRQQKAAIRILKKFELVPIDNEDAEWANTALIEHYLKSNADTFDCFIAATAHRLQIPLHTRNLKHFQPLIGNLAQKPY